MPDTNKSETIDEQDADRVNLENELRSRAKQQEALAQLGERALAEPDLERLLNDAVLTVALTLAVDFVKILELLPGGGELVLRAGFGWNVESRRHDSDGNVAEQFCPLHAGSRKSSRHRRFRRGNQNSRSRNMCGTTVAAAA